MLTMLPLRVGMGRGRDRADDAKRRVFFEHDAVIAATPVRPQPFDAGNVFDDLKLFDFMIEPTDFGFVQFNAAPLGGIGLGQRFDNVDGLAPCGHAALLQLGKRRRRRLTGGTGLLKNTKLSAGGGVGWLGTMAFGLGCGGGGTRLDRTEPAQNFFDHFANKLFVDCG
jgi:hypothetical protein